MSRHLRSSTIKGLLLMALAMPLAAAADKVVYKIVDKNGKVTFTDKQPPGNVKYEVLKIPNPKAAPTPPARPRDNVWPPAAPADTKPVFRGYRSIQVTSPSHDHTVLHDQLEVAVKLALTPRLQPGHKVQLVFDGEVLDESDSGASFVLRELERGSHQIQVNILDENGKTVGSSDTVTIHVKRPIARGALALPRGG